ncbi:putative membrane protein YGL010W [Lutibacter sp. Hel_I_33_5]|uniref:Mpo1 family 2-hydroxy fatty acid dioxygenase n=1 Tax=Lutibacter sp. Hel_I_33_5 TaxID=1566289 RepID=UPI00119FD107|nr:Mpo1-like protein [Lutibacter sp. Hel_I_33_5]TVZ55313.1 putative membrane protein YGL010W [Lutibacter sp. Hel_I_33_5]
MKTAKEWFNEYAISHQNESNIIIHYICVPAIFFSVVGLLMCIPTGFLESTFGLYNPFIENWAAVLLSVILLLFYLRLGFWYFIEMFVISTIFIIINNWIDNHFNLLWVSLGIFIIAWIGQFYGHKIEGKKPSFIKDLQFLLIGPLWVIQKIGGKK